MDTTVQSTSDLAIDGGKPVREEILAYGGQTIGEDDVSAVAETLRSDWLTTGPKVDEFEEEFADFVGAEEAVTVSNGTAALHAAMHVIGISPGDEVIVPTMTFAATANSVTFEGGTPVFADVDPDTLLLDPKSVEEKIGPDTEAIVGVDYMGQPCRYDALRDIAETHDLVLLDDACHAIGGSYKGRPVGSLADLNTFSLHPVKNMTTGEGGMITTDDAEWAKKMRQFRNHGITSTHHERSEEGSWYYEIPEAGYNYRLTDFQCALGMSQLEKLPGWVERRREIAARYDEAFGSMEATEPLKRRDDATCAYHLYVIRLALDRLQVDRKTLFEALQAEGIGVNVHYIPVHLQPHYRENLGTEPGLCPNAEAGYERILTLPVFPRMAESDMEDVIRAVRKVLSTYRR
ncbi:UDP-4-amino-4,6-dideoxy-N-acetyl-beta-L-altrosamine transaminase [Salinibacter ruber]|uniref:Perosamine synthetase n=1 Tax=Salinibacter ruber TaxID=146919 RepID=A0A9X2TJW8_9BACT|nr:UDP-4-amino-4,6-dideoxy-N-acetyl-beta-L-altrosamine transaminase [Salinibacter ruber]MCS3661170.1 perosamine synthetase [Salinibacter ruber]MCS3710969.1 perosamine synthetase [Salinibacter ruber]